jgi:transposase-like protein
LYIDEKKMNCPKCNSGKHVKDGIVKGKQRYFCKECKYRYTVKHLGKPIELKKAALYLYLEGLGFRSIERFLKVSNVSVMNWIKGFGKEIESLRKTDGTIEIVEMDELHTYIGLKKTTFGYGLLLIDLENGTSTLSLAREVQKQG